MSTVYAYITDYFSNTLNRLDTSNNTYVGSPITLQQGPFCVSITPDGSKVYVTNANQNSVSVVSTSSFVVIATITSVINATLVSITADGSKGYVTTSSSTVYIISTSSNSVTGTFSLPAPPNNLAISPVGTRAYFTQNNTTPGSSGNVWVVDTSSNTLIYTVGLGRTIGNGLVVSPDGTRVYVATENNIKILDTTGTPSVIDTITGRSGRLITISPDGSTLYVTYPTEVYKIAIAGSIYTYTQLINNPNSPVGISITPDGSAVYVTTFTQNLIYYINTTNNAVTNLPFSGTARTTGTFVACFAKDSKILYFNKETESEEYIHIQDLRRGDLVKTLNHGFLPVHMIGYRDIYNTLCNDATQVLYKCSPDQYPELTEDLIMTGGHSVLVDNFKNEEEREKTLEQFGDIFMTDNKYRLPLCIDERAIPYTNEGIYTVYHFSLENDNDSLNYGIYANGLLVESCSTGYLRDHSGMILM
uniref:Hedgehog/Intein (Hint) domain-containing protein n=1 Tax=viral metagenome TaxID=1070528 RepID=A0A6C0E6V1_9ZZZZ